MSVAMSALSQPCTRCASAARKSVRMSAPKAPKVVRSSVACKASAKDR